MSDPSSSGLEGQLTKLGKEGGLECAGDGLGTGRRLVSGIWKGWFTQTVSVVVTSEPEYFNS
jgi:hypothetical protein